MTKIAVLSDTHFGARNDAISFSSYFEQFYTQIFFPYLKENHISRVFHCGDIFERRKYINFRSLSEARRWFFEPMRDYQMDLIVGNHDTFFKNTNNLNSPDLLLGEYDNIHVISEPEIIEVGGTHMAMLPWVCSDNFSTSMEFLSKTKAQLLFGHLEIRGFEMHIGSASKSGFEQDVFSKFQKVFSGHFHHRSTRGNIQYLGSPYEITWSDFNDPRGFHVFDTETREMEFIPNPLRMFHRIVYNDTNEKMIEQWIETGDFEQYRDRILRIDIENKGNEALYQRVIDKIESVEPVDYTADDRSLVLQIDQDMIEDFVDDIPVLIQNVAQSIPNEKLREPLAEMLGELYRNAVNQTTL